MVAVQLSFLRIVHLARQHPELFLARVDREKNWNSVESAGEKDSSVTAEIRDPKDGSTVGGTDCILYVDIPLCFGVFAEKWVGSHQDSQLMAARLRWSKQILCSDLRQMEMTVNERSLGA